MVSGEDQSRIDPPSAKRRRRVSPSCEAPTKDSDRDPTRSSETGQCVTFRNVSACTRCRMRKNKCDQRLPRCASCAKADVACVGYDPLTKRAIPRSYVLYMESRVEQLEEVLVSHGVSVPASDNLTLIDSASLGNKNTPSSDKVAQLDHPGRRSAGTSTESQDYSRPGPGSSDFGSLEAGWLASVSGVSFSFLILRTLQQLSSPNAVKVGKVSVPNEFSERQHGASKVLTYTPDACHLDPSSIPPKALGLHLATLYFEHVNPHIPILHRGDFMRIMDLFYERGAVNTRAHELYIINMVFAMGCDVMSADIHYVSTEQGHSNARLAALAKETKNTPESYYLNAIAHMVSCLTSTDCGLEMLQAILMLAHFALLRHVPPGIWHITGIAMHLAIDLGLHQEQVEDSDEADGPSWNKGAHPVDESRTRISGQAQWMCDMRRRLWWCTYAFDRLVSACVGRPFGINEHAITTELPSILDDEFITSSGFPDPSCGAIVSYKHASHHHFRLNLLQSEMIQVLQYNQGRMARAAKKGHNTSTQASVPCPFISRFDSFGSWFVDMEKRLHLWRASIPTPELTGVAYSPDFLEMGYWQAILMLHTRLGSTSAMHRALNRKSTHGAFANLPVDAEQSHLKVAEASQKIIWICRQLHLRGLTRYTFISTRQLFVAGISYLEAIRSWQSLRNKTLDEVDLTVLSTKSMFTDMISKCPQASELLEIFDQLAKSVISVVSPTLKGQKEIPPQRPSPQLISASVYRSPDVSACGSVQDRPLNVAPGKLSASPDVTCDRGEASQQIQCFTTPAEPMYKCGVMNEDRRQPGINPYWVEAYNDGNLDAFDSSFFGS